ncbi:hypothetical protein [Sphingobacterium paludis]|nr:hypothetical protein [Sphingobacterium paludis]
MGKRPRISNQKVGEVIIDTEQYIANKGSKNARKILDKTLETHIEIWFDKHFWNRYQFGDDNGGERKGIEPLIIQGLIIESLTHILHYSFYVPGFSFLNKVGGRSCPRLVLKKNTVDGILNVVIAFFYTDDHKYEITVYTAMCVDDFKVQDGQYIITLDGANSILEHFRRKTFSEIDHL